MSGTYLIFGGGGGIGGATARLLAARGLRVHLAGRDGAKLRAIGAEVGGGWTACDVLEDGAIARAVTEAGPAIAGLVYAVGSINLKPLARLTSTDFIRDFRLNAEGAALAVQAALPALKANEGMSSITLFSSVAARQGFTAHASVAMAKGAVEGLTLALAAELAPKIRVNCIAPSLTNTPLAAALTGNPQMAAAIAQMHPLPRLGEADDVARMATFLATDDASWITGQVFGVDGGRSTLRVKG